jgi:hypothetical protein
VQEPVHRYAVRRHLAGKFSQFVTAGAAVGAVADPFKDRQKAFWDDLVTSIDLHHIKRVIAIDHRDCGAAKIANGVEKVSNPTIETETHRTAMGEFRKQVAQELKVETGLMVLNGKLEMFKLPATSATRRGPDRRRRC